MFDFLIDNIFVMFGGRVYQHTVGIPMGTNCAPLPADLFLYSYETEFLEGRMMTKEKTKAQTLNVTFLYVDYVLSIEKAKFGGYLHSIYSSELAIKDTTNTLRLYDKLDDFNSPIVNFLFIDSNIPAAPAYGMSVCVALLVTALRYEFVAGSNIPGYVANSDHNKTGTNEQNSDLEVRVITVTAITLFVIALLVFFCALYIKRKQLHCPRLETRNYGTGNRMVQDVAVPLWT